MYVDTLTVDGRVPGPFRISTDFESILVVYALGHNIIHIVLPQLPPSHANNRSTLSIPGNVFRARHYRCFVANNCLFLLSGATNRERTTILIFRFTDGHTLAEHLPAVRPKVLQSRQLTRLSHNLIPTYSMARHRLRARCKYISPCGAACSTLVPLANNLRYPRDGNGSHYCASHEATVLARKSAYMAHTNVSSPILYSSTFLFHSTHFPSNSYVAFIPPHLEKRSQLVLRNLIAQPPRGSDIQGFIYALELAGVYIVFWDFGLQRKRAHRLFPARSYTHQGGPQRRRTP